MSQECLVGDGGGVAVPLLRGERPEAEALLGALAEVWVRGVDIDWPVVFEGSGAQRVSLPTYAFQRERYWLEDSRGAGDMASAGQTSAEHPLLSAVVALAGEGEGWLFTGRLSLRSHPWLRDHSVMGQVLMPGAAFVELALTAGERVGSAVIEELTLERPLLLDDEHGVVIQLSVSQPEEAGRRSLSIYSRAEAEEAEWIRHASGVLVGEGVDTDIEPESPISAQWPPPGAQELDSEFLYDRLAEAGYNYGPAFQGLVSAWRLGDELYAEVALEAEQPSYAATFAIPPALLDSALHAVSLAALESGRTSELEVPFAFSGVHLRRRGASSLRVRLSREGESKQAESKEGATNALSLLALDEAGAPVISVQALQTRAIDRSSFKAARPASYDALFELRWVELPPFSPNGSSPHVAALGDGWEALGSGVDLESHPDLAALEEAVKGGAAAPELVLLDASAVGGGGLVADVHAHTARMLKLLQAWIASEPLAEAKLLLVTRGAVSVKGEAPNLAEAALVGLFRSAQSEHPGRFGLLDLDGSEASGAAALHGALLSEEPELALRDGLLYTPRLGRAAPPAQEPALKSFDADRTVLITGGTGGLGALLARHLVAERGVRHLLLASRRGEKAAGARELASELRELGCELRIVACDVSHKPRLQELLDSIPAEHPLGVVIHTAGVLDDGVIESLDDERLARVLAPKVDAAINLHELIGAAELILFSSVAATVGSPGQANYAAANAFLDALAVYRHAHDLPGMSLAWGAWEQATGMTDALRETDRARVERLGVSPLSAEQGLGLFDIASGIEQPLLVPMRLDTPSLRAQAKAGMLPAILQGLIRMPLRRGEDAKGALIAKLANAPESKWDAIVLELVRGQAAIVLGHASYEAVDPRRAFKELGFDSLAAVEFRNRLVQTTGLKLPSTLIFDHPNCAAVATLVRSKMSQAGAVPAAIDAELDRLDALLPSIATDSDEQNRVKARLQALTRRVEGYLADDAYAATGEADADVDVEVEDALESATDDEVFALIDKRREGQDESAAEGELQ
jgi:NAD(P)-dependent dehydrogenase (short-subunit alcohol dehydrogenase family)/acyl carrier protein